MPSGMHTLLPYFVIFSCCLSSTLINCKHVVLCIKFPILPTVFQNLFTLNSNVHDHKTRHSSKLHVISHRTKSHVYSIQMYGVRLWNMLSKDITDVPSVSIFKSKCKKHLIYT